MVYVFVKSEIENFEQWKSVFDQNFNLRKQNGSKEERVFQNQQNKNEIAILLEWDSLEKANKFFTSQEIKERMAEAGVIGKPDISFLSEL